MPSLDNTQLEEFLITGRHVMKLATLDPEGWPYVVPIWYHYEDGVFLMAGRTKSQWVEHIRNDGRVSACIDSDEPVHRRAQVKGTAEIVDDQWVGDWSSWSIRYSGEEEGRKYYEETKHMPRVLVRITPSKITTWAGPGWHPRYTED